MRGMSLVGKNFLSGQRRCPVEQYIVVYVLFNAAFMDQASPMETLQTKTPPKFKLQSHPKLTTNNSPLHTETTHTRSHYPIPHLIPPSLSGNCLHRSSQSHDLADDLLAPLPVPEHPLTLHLLLQCAGSVFLSGESAPTRPPLSPSKPAPPVHTNHHLGTSPLPATDRRAVALPRNNSRLTRRTWSVVSTAP